MVNVDRGARKNGESGFAEPKPPSDPDGNENNSSEDDEPLVDITEDDMEELNSQLDELHSALDDIEQRNDNIQSKLLALLKSSREEREKASSAPTADMEVDADPQEEQE